MYGPVERDNGRVVGVHFDQSDGWKSFYPVGTQAYAEFLEWNSTQPSPLDVSDHEPPVKTFQEKLDASEIGALRKLAAVIKTLDVTLTNAQKNALPQWVKNELTDAMTKITNAGG